MEQSVNLLKGRRVKVILRRGEAEGILVSADKHMNVVLRDGILRLNGEERPFGKAKIRGQHVVMVYPVL